MKLKAQGVLAAVMFCVFVVCAAKTHAMAVPFEGTVDFKHGELNLNFGEGDRRLAVEAFKPAHNRYRVSVDIDHVGNSACDLAARVSGDFELTSTSTGKKDLLGELKSSYTFINRKPVDDVLIKFSVRQEKLIIDALYAGPFSARGEVGLMMPYKANLSLELLSADLEDILELAKADKRYEYELTGVVTGAVVLNGPLSAPAVRGKIASYNGRVNRLGYDSIVLQFNGDFPRLVLEQSQVTQAEGLTFKVEGPIDLKDTSRLAAQIAALKKVPVVTADKTKREWVIRRMSGERDSVTQMTYFFTKDDRGEATGVVGMEKRFDF